MKTKKKSRYRHIFCSCAKSDSQIRRSGSSPVSRKCLLKLLLHCPLIWLSSERFPNRTPHCGCLEVAEKSAGNLYRLPILPLVGSDGRHSLFCFPKKYFSVKFSAITLLSSFNEILSNNDRKCQTGASFNGHIIIGLARTFYRYRTV